MVEYIYSLKAGIGGPLLLNRDKLFELDQILDGIWKELETWRQQEIAQETEAYVNERVAEDIKGASRVLSGADLEKKRKEYDNAEYRAGLAEGYGETLMARNRPSREVTVSCGPGRTIEAHFLREIDDKLAMDSLTAKSIFFSLYSANRQVSISIEDGVGIGVSPEADEKSHTMFLKLKSWAESVRPNVRVRLWCSQAAQYVVGLFMVFFVIGVVGILTDQVTTQPGKEATKEEARKLIAEGITPSNQSEALRVILSLESESYPQQPAANAPDQKTPTTTPGPEVGPRTTVKKVIQGLFLALLGVSVIVCLPPKTRLGLGAGQARVERTRKWINTVTVTLPSWVVASFILPWLTKIIQAIVG